MNRSTAFALITAAGSLPLGVIAANLASAAPRALAQAAPVAPASPTSPASPAAADVVDAADAFLATLSEEQRAIAQIELKPQLAIRRTNFPGGSNVRNGVSYRDLKPEQVQAALKVARVAPGEEGFVTRARRTWEAIGATTCASTGPASGSSSPRRAATIST